MLIAALAFVAVLLVLARPLGRSVNGVLAGRRTFAPAFARRLGANAGRRLLAPASLDAGLSRAFARIASDPRRSLFVFAAMTSLFAGAAGVAKVFAP